jgi:hypothetical protein
MNRLPTLKPIDLGQALENVDRETLDDAAVTIAEHGVASALELSRQREREEERQRDLDAALADAIEVVARHRLRVGRRVCSRKDGETIRRIHELLRAMTADSGADADASFQ